MAKLTHDEIVAREGGLYQAAVAARRDPVFVIARDRLARYAAHRKTFTVPEAVALWANRMAAVHGPEIRCYNNTVDWITALLICRYGEAEYFWPDDTFTPGDIARAAEWSAGKIPEGVSYL